MSYTVFALKWRPQNFDEIIGQSHISTTLKNALEKNRLAHAYLFAGPRGVGKTSTARILAKALNCKDSPAVNPCGKCPSCIDITKGNSMDVIEIDGASNRQIDDIRALRENVKFCPSQGKFKIYIIDEVHMLTTEAFNALLKTLEEPPSFVKFIFATTHAHKVPSTILSRCQRLDFRRIKALEIVEQLEKIIKAENMQVDRQVLFAIAKSSDGSLRDAESILDQLGSFTKDKVSLKDVISVLGLIEQDVLFEITDKIIAKDASSALELLDKVIDEGKDIALFTMNLIEHFRNLMIAKITKADSNLIDLPQETCESLLKQSNALSLEEIFSFFNIMVSAQEMGKRLDSLRVPLEISLVRLAYNKKGEQAAATTPVKIPQQAAIKPNLPHFEKGGCRGDLYTNKEIKPEEPVLSVTLEDIQNIWHNIFEKLSKVKMSIATYFNEGIPVKVENNILVISFPQNYSLHKESLEEKANNMLVERTVSELLKNNLKVNFVLSKDLPVKTVHKDSFVESALKTFDGRLIKEG